MLRTFPGDAEQNWAAISLPRPASCRRLLCLALSHPPLLPVSLSQQGGMCHGANLVCWGCSTCLLTSARSCYGVIHSTFGRNRADQGQSPSHFYLATVDNPYMNMAYCSQSNFDHNILRTKYLLLAGGGTLKYK